MPEEGKVFSFLFLYIQQSDEVILAVYDDYDNQQLCLSEKGEGFTFLLWNGEYGEEAIFVVRDNSNNQQSYFTPGKTDELSWTNKDLTKDSRTELWTDFENETVDDLDDVVF